jgi:hypothetical protein
MGVLFLLVGVGGVIASWGAYFTDMSIEKHGFRANAHPMINGPDTFYVPYPSFDKARTWRLVP